MNLRMTLLLFVATSCLHRDIPARCEFSGFQRAPYDHVITTLPTITTSSFAGRLKVSSNDVTDGLWPSGMDAKIELHGPNALLEFVPIGDNGSFSRPGLEAGTYCFKVSSSGFGSKIGTLVIDHGDSRGGVEIELRLAE